MKKEGRWRSPLEDREEENRMKERDHRLNIPN
ncbi:hypothetical protein COLO4_02906 [Corchorus olitorius]|uniref:Uncharacterized protein n=1 Tax=Corchorus olitorius TaxID=93759 RepID=A0A1R3L005_9ROSI|nr:hypothetical protein COLO4_02906 [Corchorus olitorius]